MRAIVKLRIDNGFGPWFRVISSVAAAFHPALVAATSPEGIWLRAARDGDRRFHEVRIRREESGARLACLMRDFRGAADDLRVGLEVPMARGRFVVGHQRHLGGVASSGWRSALAARRPTPRAALSLGRTASGVSWSGPLGGLPLRTGVGRHPSGAVVAGVGFAWRGLEFEGARDRGVSSARIGWARRASRLPWQVEIARTGGEWLLRSGLGGGAAPVGAIGVLRGEGDHRAWSVAGGVRARRGSWRGTRAEVRVGRRAEGDSSHADSGASGLVALHVGSWRLESEVRSRRTSDAEASFRYRLAAESRIRGATARLSVSVPGGRAQASATLRIEAGPPRSRTGVRVDLPSGRGRRVALWLTRKTGFGDVRLAFGRNRGEPASVEVEWGRVRRRGRTRN
jgi:hypothetical protein